MAVEAVAAYSSGVAATGPDCRPACSRTTCVPPSTIVIGLEAALLVTASAQRISAALICGQPLFTIKQWFSLICHTFNEYYSGRTSYHRGHFLFYEGECSVNLMILRRSTTSNSFVSAQPLLLFPFLMSNHYFCEGREKRQFPKTTANNES